MRVIVNILVKRVHVLADVRIYRPIRFVDHRGLGIVSEDLK